MYNELRHSQASLNIMFSARYFKYNLLVFCKYLICVSTVFYLIILLFDVLELLRITTKCQVSLLEVVTLSVMKNYISYSKCIPVIVLVSSLLFFRNQHNNNEVIAAKSLGIGIFQIIAPCLLTALLFGILNITLLHPIGMSLLQKHHNLLSRSFKGEIALKASPKIWLKSKLEEDSIILNALKASDKGRILYEVKIFIVKLDGTLKEYITADQATLETNAIILKNCTILHRDQDVIAFKEKWLPIVISTLQVRSNISAVDTLSLYRFLEFIRSANQSGLSSDKYMLYFMKHLLSPFLLTSTILLSFYFCDNFKDSYISYTVCLVVGFIMLFSNHFICMMGESRCISIYVATFSPVLLFNTLGTYLLLNKI